MRRLKLAKELTTSCATLNPSIEKLTSVFQLETQSKIKFKVLTQKDVLKHALLS
jgi:hypothetical protein